MTSRMIYIVDFGSQTAHLIGRRIRDLGIEHIVTKPSEIMSAIQKQKPAGIIFSGGPSSVYEKNAPTIDKKIFQLNIPILGICYGWQLTAHLLDGKVVQGSREYGPTKVTIDKHNPLFKGIATKDIAVWMSHGDEVVMLPTGFDYHAFTPQVKAAGVADIERNIFGLQFHPEVEHTQEGRVILKNFVEKVCGLKTAPRSISVDQITNEIREQVEQYDNKSVAIAAVSGGVDSTVASALVAKALGKRFIPIFCNNGLMRYGTDKEVRMIFQDILGVKPMIVNCKKDFLRALKDVADPEKKRIIIGKKYIDTFVKAAEHIPHAKFLVQGTIYSDVIESKGSEHAHKIKSHHNVGGLPKNLTFTLIEPLRSCYKDEVRMIGRRLGLPEWVTQKQPFPGPGYAIRIIGKVTEQRLLKEIQADQIVCDVLKKHGMYDKVFQSFAIMTGALSTAVKGDGRIYGEVVAIRVYDSSDVMTAGWSHLPYDIMQELSTRIVNEVEGVSRVVYDITTKPPATMEWE